MPPTWILVALFLSLSSYHGTEGGRSFSNEFQRQPMVQLEDGDEFHCVDIYKQPAFDHIFLKNHKIQMNPSFMPELRSNINSQLLFSKLERELKGCPPGKVPIPRARVNHNLKELRPLSQLHLGSAHQLSADRPGRHFATFASRQVVHGARASIDLQNPAVKANQISMATMWIEGGPQDEVNSIQIGWAVHPRIYGDNLTRVTAYWTADASKKTGCYNLMCPGFVQVHPTLHFGQVYPDMSVFGGHQYITTPLVYKDPKTGNWWAVFDDGIKIGYWPKEIFTHLKEVATFLRFGGWTYNSPDGESPPMGSGRLPDNHYKESCFFSHIEVMTERDFLIDIDGTDFIKFADNKSCYDAIYWGNQGGVLRETFTFGGPGGLCGI